MLIMKSLHFFRDQSLSYLYGFGYKNQLIHTFSVEKSKRFQYVTLSVLTRSLSVSFCQVQLKALQTLESVFQCRERSIAFPFINALAPHIVMVLNDMCVNKPTNEDQLTVTLEAIKILENLVELTDDNLSMQLPSISSLFTPGNTGAF